MKFAKNTTLMALSALAVMTGSASSQPPDVVQSDAGFNTAMGTDALRNLPAPHSQQDNTASGYAALYSDTGGGGNTATGARALYSNTTGNYNSAFGREVLYSTTTGTSNIGMGEAALYFNTVGSDNVAVGLMSLFDNRTGFDNTAVGSHALEKTTVNDNTAFGFLAMQQNTTGTANTANGSTALLQNETGSYNTAMGMQTLYGNLVGNNNTATGYDALYANTNGSSNTANGRDAMRLNKSGYHNTSVGASSMYSNTTGNENTVLGFGALYSNTTGGANIAVGLNAGSALTTGRNNIDIGNRGVAGEGATIRIGTAGTHAATYVAGITSAHITGSPVYVTSSGQLGVLASSERYKTDVSSLDEDAARLTRLRAVRYHLKSDPGAGLQYGLIAEEVAYVYPELVIRDENGTIQGVRYDELAPLLLTEVQHEQQTLQEQAGQLGKVLEQLAALRKANDRLSARIEKMSVAQAGATAASR